MIRLTHVDLSCTGVSIRNRKTATCPLPMCIVEDMILYLPKYYRLLRRDTNTNILNCTDYFLNHDVKLSVTHGYKSSNLCCSSELLLEYAKERAYVASVTYDVEYNPRTSPGNVGSSVRIRNIRKICSKNVSRGQDDAVIVDHFGDEATHKTGPCARESSRRYVSSAVGCSMLRTRREQTLGNFSTKQSSKLHRLQYAKLPHVKWIRNLYNSEVSLLLFSMVE